jgi:hypothetical protein
MAQSGLYPYICVKFEPREKICVMNYIGSWVKASSGEQTSVGREATSS